MVLWKRSTAFCLCEVLALAGDGFVFAHGLSYERDAIGVVHDAVEDGVGERGIAEKGVPLIDG